MFTVLWCYMRNNAFKVDGVNYEVSADLTGQANHLGVTIEADIIKQKLPENNGGYNASANSDGSYGKTNQAGLRQADHRPSDRSLPLSGGQLLHGPNRSDQQRRRTRATATWPRPCDGRHQQARRREGLISGRKAFQRPMEDGRRSVERDSGRVPRQRRITVA